MKLFLSSYRAGGHEAKLLELIGSIRKVAVITNAKDYKTAEDRKIKVEENLAYWTSLGIEPTEIDLRSYFHKKGAEHLLSNHGFIWLAGGNTFLLRRALKYSGLDNYLTTKVRDGSIVLGGESAGALIAGPSLKYAEFETDEDSPDYVADGYEKEVIWDGLGLTKYVPVPHYGSEDYGAETEEYINKLDKFSIPHREMTDGQAIVINGDKEEYLK